MPVRIDHTRCERDQGAHLAAAERLEPAPPKFFRDLWRDGPRKAPGQFLTNHQKKRQGWR